VLSFELGDVNALDFNELLFENPLFHRRRTRLKLGLSALELKSYRDVPDAAPLRPSGQEKVLVETRRRAAGARLYDQAMKLALQKVKRLDTEERNAALAQSASWWMRRSAPRRWRGWRSCRRRRTAWPLLTFKLARVCTPAMCRS
jgi:hypothetical protein